MDKVENLVFVKFKALFDNFVVIFKYLFCGIYPIYSHLAKKILIVCYIVNFYKIK